MMLHILWKDTRRLWPGIVATIAVLASLAWQDRGRADWLAGPVEGYLNLVVPLLWGCLLALAVEQDPIPGDRQFWITRPFSRGSMLAAKLLFALLFVHLPSLLADAYVLAARGFSPVAYAPQLLMKQLVWACALTIPAMALASLVRSFSHFVMEVAAVAVVLLVVAGPYSGFYPYQWEPIEAARKLLIVTLLVCAGIAVLALEYFGRRVLLSRAIGVAAGVGAALIFFLVMPPAALAIRATLSPSDAAPSIQLDPSPRSWRPYASRQVTVALPIALTGLPPEARANIDMVRSEIETASGTRYSETRPVRYNPSARRSHDFSIGWITPSQWNFTAPEWALLSIDPRLFDAMAARPVTIRGEAAIGMFRLGAATWMPIGATADAPGIGKCMTADYEEPFGAGRIKVECESPARNPGGSRVRLWSPVSGREWKNTLGNARTFANGPAITWLSPLHRDLTYFTVNDIYNYTIRHAEMPGARVEITPLISMGTAAVRFEFRDIDLRKYVVPPQINRGFVR
jgi:hypothetical protein